MSRTPAVALMTLAIVVAVASPSAQARDPKWGGLGAVDVSRDGKTVVTGGANRVLYVLDAASLQVARRAWLEARIGNLAFSRDGSRLLVEDDEETLHYLATDSWKPVARVAKAGFISVAPGADLLAALESNTSKGATIRFLSTLDGSVKGSVVIDSQVSGFDMSPDGTALAVLTAPVDGNEQKLPDSQMPKGLTGVQREEFKQKHDGKVSSFRVYAAPSGTPKSSVSLLYSSRDDDTLLVRRSEGTYVVNYENVLARLSDDGKLTLFQAENSYNYGRGVARDQHAVLTGGLRDASLTRLPDRATLKVKLDQIAGWPEYFEAFAFGANGVAYGVTSAHRIVEISPQGSLTRSVPVF